MFFKPLKMAIIVRADLKLSRGKTASQTAHAAVMCFKKSFDSTPKLCEKWMNSGQPKIVLKAVNLSDLENLMEQSVKAGITNTLVRDAGRTEISPGTATCLGIGPDYDDKIDEIVKNLKLL